MLKVSYIVPTIGRATLADTLASIEAEPGDEILVVGVRPGCDVARHRAARFLKCSSGRDWGCKERTLGIAHARGDYLAFIDDDDAYVAGARAEMTAAMRAAPGRPSLFRVAYPNGTTLWNGPVLRCGNVGTQMILLPNDPTRLGRWTPRYEGDYDFLASMRWTPAEIAWWPTVIARMGH